MSPATSPTRTSLPSSWSAIATPSAWRASTKCSRLRAPKFSGLPIGPPLVRTRSPSGSSGRLRRECLDQMLVFHRRHLEQVLAQFVDHYNEHRPHRSLGQQAPLAMGKKPLRFRDPDPARLRRSDKLGGLIHEDRLVA